VQPLPPDSLRDMPPEEFRRFGERVVGFITDYLSGVEDYSVLPNVLPGDIKAQLPTEPPQHPEPMETILDDFESILMRGMTHWNRGGFLAYFANSASAPGILGEALCAALNQNAMLWKTSPSATELEEVVLDWVRQMLDLPSSFRGVITDTASMSSLLAIAAARNRVPGLNVREEGLGGRPNSPRLRLYTSDQAHSSIEKAAILLGVGLNGVRKIATDEGFRMRPEALAQAIEEDIADGWTPFCVVATAGTTSTTAVDPIPEIAAICRETDLWLHVDAAYGGAAAVAPEFRHVLAGCEHAHSLVMNPHKWLFTPMDCSLLFVHDPESLRRTFSLIPDYLVTREEGVTNFMDYGVQLGRRFRALKLWMILRYFGQEGLAERIRYHVALAKEFAAWVDGSAEFERLTETNLSVVCFRASPQGVEADALNALNEELLRRVNEDGRVFLSHTKLRGKICLRIAIGNIGTSREHLAAAWELLHRQSKMSDCRPLCSVYLSCLRDCVQRGSDGLRAASIATGATRSAASLTTAPAAASTPAAASAKGACSAAAGLSRAVRTRASGTAAESTSATHHTHHAAHHSTHVDVDADAGRGEGAVRSGRAGSHDGVAQLDRVDRRGHDFGDLGGVGDFQDDRDLIREGDRQRLFAGDLTGRGCHRLRLGSRRLLSVRGRAAGVLRIRLTWLSRLPGLTARPAAAIASPAEDAGKRLRQFARADAVGGDPRRHALNLHLIPDFECGNLNLGHHDEFGGRSHLDGLRGSTELRLDHDDVRGRIAARDRSHRERHLTAGGEVAAGAALASASLCAASLSARLTGLCSLSARALRLAACTLHWILLRACIADAKRHGSGEQTGVKCRPHGKAAQECIFGMCHR
jgi:aromatic-L-amino-acid decarboxylase